MRRKLNKTVRLTVLLFAVVLAACTSGEETTSTASTASGESPSPSSESDSSAEQVPGALAAADQTAPVETTTTVPKITTVPETLTTSTTAATSTFSIPPTSDPGESSFGALDAIAVYERGNADRIAYATSGIVGEATFEQALEVTAHQDPDFYVGSLENGARQVYECQLEFPPVEGLERDQIEIEVHHVRQRLLREDVWVLEISTGVRLSRELAYLEGTLIVVTPNGVGPTIASNLDGPRCGLPRPDSNKLLIEQGRELYADVVGPDAIGTHVRFWNSRFTAGNISNLEPGARLIVTFGHVEYQVGELVADASGVAEIDVRVPPGTPPGASFLRIRDAHTGEDVLIREIVVEIPLNCRSEAVVGAPDIDGDGVIDACDRLDLDGPLADADGDLVLNGEDNCPLVPNFSQDGLERASVGFACDPDEGHNSIDPIVDFPN